MSRQHPMSRILKRIFIVYGLALAIAVVGLHQTAEPVRAECNAADFGGNARECTYTEEVRDCVRNAVDAYWDCASGGGYWHGVVCYGFYTVDFYACLPLGVVKVALR